MKRLLLGLLCAFILATAFAPAATAQTKNFEIYGGYLVPGEKELDTDLTYGLRFGSRPKETFGWQLGLGKFDLNNEDDRPLAGEIGDANAYFLEASLMWFPGGKNFAVFVGPGYGRVDIDIEGTTKDESEDSLNYHFGIAYMANVGESFYIRPDIRLRKWEGERYTNTDNEYSIGFGWKF